MGGYVGLYLAKHQPEKIDKVITLATKFHWDEPTAQKECGMLNAEAIAGKVPAFAASLEERHAPNDWKDVLGKTKDMLSAMGKDNPLKPDDYKNINTASLILLGDRDKMVPLDETVAVYRSLPDAQMGILPGTPHPIEQIDPELLAFHITRFMQ
jgi:pimeloyl-ACP methyl ester carboxylesterase